APPGQTLMHADRRDAELEAASDERLAHRGEPALVIVEPPRATARVEEVGEVRERLPRADRVAARGVLHPAEHRADRAHVRQDLAVKEYPFVAAQALHDATGLGHDLGRQRRTLGIDR